MIIESNLKLAQFIKSDELGASVVSLESSASALMIAGAIVQDVKKYRQEKNIKPQMHWDFYNSWQEKYFIQRKYEDEANFDARKKNAQIVNYIRFVVDLDTRFLYGRPNKIGRKYGDNDKSETRMREINKLIGIDNLQMEAKRMASLYGEQGFRLIPVDKRTGSQVEFGSQLSENVYPHPVPLDPRKTFFLLNAYGKIIAVVLKWDFVDYVNESKTVEVTELITDDSRWLWHDDILQDAEVNKYTLRDEFVLEKNNPQRVDDVQDMLVLQTAINECLTDNSYFFSRHGRPQLVTDGIDLKNVLGNDNQVWQLDTGDAENKKILDMIGFLVWDGKMEAAADHIRELTAMLFNVSSTAAISTGDLKGIGNLRSGAALETAHSPSIQKAKEKQIIWAENEERLANAVVSFDSILHSTTIEKRFPEYSFTVHFPQDSGVPGSEILNAEVKQISIQSHIKTLRSQIQEDNPKFNKAEVEAYRQEILKDSSEIVDSVVESKKEEEGQPSGGSSQSKKTEQTKPTAK